MPLPLPFELSIRVLYCYIHSFYKNETQNIWSEQHHLGAVPAPTSNLGAVGGAEVYKWRPFNIKILPVISLVMQSARKPIYTDRIFIAHVQLHSTKTFLWGQLGADL